MNLTTPNPTIVLPTAPNTVIRVTYREDEPKHSHDRWILSGGELWQSIGINANNSWGSRGYDGTRGLADAITGFKILSEPPRDIPQGEYEEMIYDRAKQETAEAVLKRVREVHEGADRMLNQIAEEFEVTA